MTRARKFALSLSIFLSLIPTAAWAGTVTGKVTNGTTGQPGAGVQVILIQLQNGMQPVANSVTDAQGHFQFTHPGIGGQMPMLIRAVYRDVFYHEAIAQGKTTADITVYEPTDKPGSVSILTHAVILQPSGSDLVVGEEFSIENKTQPPQTFVRQDGSFLFSLPDGAQLDEISAGASAGMPVVQSAIDKGKNQKAIAYAFRPGQNEVRISYKLPYVGNQARLRVISPYSASRLVVVAPPTVQIAGEGLSPAGQEQGFNVYLRPSLAANTPLNISLSGTAQPPPQDTSSSGAPPQSAPAPDNSQNPSVNSRLEQSGAEAPTTAATTMPARLDSLKWILVAGFAAIFALGLIFLWRRPQFAIAPAAPVTAPSEVHVGASVSAARFTAKADSAVAEADIHVRGSLDELKDTLFRLELRRQAGTIGDDDYARERQRIEELLRGLVRG
jgi:hypothetical protein